MEFYFVRGHSSASEGMNESGQVSVNCILWGEMISSVIAVPSSLCRPVYFMVCIASDHVMFAFGSESALHSVFAWLLSHSVLQHNYAIIFMKSVNDT